MKLLPLRKVSLYSAENKTDNQRKNCNFVKIIFF